MVTVPVVIVTFSMLVSLNTSYMSGMGPERSAKQAGIVTFAKRPKWLKAQLPTN